MISPTNNDASERSGKSHNVSCFDDSFNSDDDLSVEQSAQSNKRQKMTEEERLTRCRERNRVHARNTRERKKSQMDGLQSRIQELVDEKKRLNSTASESSVASILMSLAGFDAPKDFDDNTICRMDSGDENNPVSFSFKVDDDEDDISLSIEKLKMQVSALLGDEDCKDIMDIDPLLSKDKSTCSTSELEMIRRERNRMHAKKTRLRKKKMIQEMETIITSLEKEVSALQGGLQPVSPKSENSPQLQHQHSIVQMKTGLDHAALFHSNDCHNNNPSAEQQTIAIKEEEDHSYRSVISIPPITSKLVPITIEVPSSSSKKRKHSSGGGSTPTDCMNTQGQIRLKNFPSPYEISDPLEVGSFIQAQEVRGSQQYLWRQHISKNNMKTVSICSETASGSSEGSVSEGDLSSGSAVHSLLHMSRTNSSDSRGSGSGSDESDTAASDQTPNSSQTNSAHSRNHINPPRIEKRVSPLLNLSSSTSHSSLGLPGLSKSPCHPPTTPKTIQAILAACESKLPPQSSVLNSTFDATLSAQNHPHWRLPERPTTHSNTSSLGTLSDVRIAASTVAAVASIYPCTDAIDDPTSYLAYVPMKAMENPGPGFQPPYDGVRNHKFTVYGGNKGVVSNSNTSLNSGNSNNLNDDNNDYNNHSNNTTVSSGVPFKKRVPTISPDSIRNIPQELDAIEHSKGNSLKNAMKANLNKNKNSSNTHTHTNTNKDDYSIYVPYGIEVIGEKYCYHDNRKKQNEENNNYYIQEKQTPLDIHRNTLTSEQSQSTSCLKAAFDLSCRLQLTEEHQNENETDTGDNK